MTGIEQFLSLVKLKMPHAAVIAVLGTSILLLPESLAGKFGLNLLTEGWKLTIGLATLTSYAALLVGATIKFFKWRSLQGKKIAYQRTVLARLSSLSPHEAQILKECFDDGRQTITVHILADAHPYAGALCSKGLLSQSYGAPGTYVTATNEIPYTIPDFVWNSPEFSVIFSDNNEDDSN